MTTEHDEPERLADVAEQDDALRAALREARGEVPSDARIAAIFARLPSGPSGGGGGGGGAPPPRVAPTSGVAVSGAIVGAVAVAILGGALYVGPRASPLTAPSAVASAAPSEVPASLPSSDASPSALPIDSATVTPSAASVDVQSTAPATAPAPPGSASAAPSASAPARSEVELLKAAQASAASSPAQALALCDEHARLYPRGDLSQEREFIRIQALMAAGRVGEARSLADAFIARNPGSAHATRLEEITGRAKPAPATSASAKPL